MIKDFHDDWSIVATCDTVTLESSHPIQVSKSPEGFGEMLYTLECKDDEIAYFKVDVNLIDSLPETYLGYVLKNYRFAYEMNLIH